MKNPIHKNKVAQLKASRGVERKMALEKGDICSSHHLHGLEDCVQPQPEEKGNQTDDSGIQGGLNMINATALRPVSAENMNVVSNVSNVLTKRS